MKYLARAELNGLRKLAVVTLKATEASIDWMKKGLPSLAQPLTTGPQ